MKLMGITVIETSLCFKVTLKNDGLGICVRCVFL